jgi:SAM-dependent methyltransferase
MNWKYKAALQGAFSNIPLGAHLNLYAQKWIQRSLPLDDAHFAHSVSLAKLHVGFLQEYGGRPLEDASFYEFGAGWELSIPLTFYALGIERQVVVDIRPLVRADLVNDTIGKLQRWLGEGTFVRRPTKYLPKGSASLPLLKEYYGIDYLAPCDARRTGLEAISVDYITSTATLEHIPPEMIRAILRECHRILKDDGLMSFRIDYQDHYAYFDPHVSVYNFLRYSDQAWRFFSPQLHYQNRLRHGDYIRLFLEADFEIVKEETVDGDEADLKILKAMPLAEQFKSYSLHELAVRASNLLLRKIG